MSHDSHDAHGAHGHEAASDADTGLSAFDDVKAHSELLKASVKRADEIIAMARRGIPKEKAKGLKQELPKLVGDLRQLLIAQLEKSGAIAQQDLSDGSYDNVYIDDALRVQIRTLRNLHIDLHTMFGTRTARKLTGFIAEDIPNLFTVKWRQLKDNLKQYAKAGILFAGAGGAAALAGYSLAMGGDFGAGATVLGKHLGIAANKGIEAFNFASPYVVDAAKNVSHGISWTFGKLSALFHSGAGALAPAHP